MTREEAIAKLKNFADHCYPNEEFLIAIDALEQEPAYCDRNICLKNEYSDIGCEDCEVTKSQEPCEDAISRQDVISRDEVCNYIAEFINHEYSTDAECEMVDLMIKGIQHMPSVKPQEPKTGHWITDVDKWGDIVTTVNGYRCDKCNAFNSDKDNYCPNCGARMVEPQESEG